MNIVPARVATRSAAPLLWRFRATAGRTQSHRTAPGRRTSAAGRARRRVGQVVGRQRVVRGASQGQDVVLLDGTASGDAAQGGRDLDQQECGRPDEMDLRSDFRSTQPSGGRRHDEELEHPPYLAGHAAQQDSYLVGRTGHMSVVPEQRVPPAGPCDGRRHLAHPRPMAVSTTRFAWLRPPGRHRDEPAARSKAPFRARPRACSAKQDHGSTRRMRFGSTRRRGSSKTSPIAGCSGQRNYG